MDKVNRGLNKNKKLKCTVAAAKSRKCKKMILSEDSILDTMVGVMQASLASGQTLKSITHMSPQHS